MRWLSQRSRAAADDGSTGLYPDLLAGLKGRPYRLTTDAWEPSPSFGFDFLADAIAKVILESEPQLTLAVYGDWGIGKTTLLHAIQERIKHRCAIGWFDLWEYKNQEHVIAHLLYAIAEALPDNSEAAEKMGQLARAALASASLRAGAVSFSGKDFLAQLDSVAKAPKVETQELAALIGRWRHDSDSRIVVIVDNLDRCLPEQSVVLLEQITSLFGFPGVIFLLAAEKDRLVAAVEEKHKLEPGEGSRYLEKVVQVEFRVPGLDQDHVLRWIDTLLRRGQPAAAPGELGEADEPSLKLSTEEGRLLAEVGRWNPRQIKRLLNNVRIQLCTARHDVAEDGGAALASTLLLHESPEIWHAITSSEATRRAVLAKLDGDTEQHADTHNGPDYLLSDDLVARTLGTPGGRRLLAMTDAEMQRFLSSAESTLTIRESTAADSAVKATIDEARAQSTRLCDLYIEGSLTNVAALVGAVTTLQGRGYVFRTCAGAGGGAVVASLLVAGYTATEIRELLLTLDYHALRRTGFGSRRRAARIDPILEWVRELLVARGVWAFADLVHDPDSRDPLYRYSLEIIVSDLTHTELLVIPRDSRKLGIDPDEFEVAVAVAASVSTPTVVAPIRHENPATGSTHELVDGELLSNYPVWLLDVGENEFPEWPTLGIRVVEDPRPVGDVGTPSSTGKNDDLATKLAQIQAATRERLHISKADLARTITIPNRRRGGIDSAPTREEALGLYEEGRDAAEHFLATWDFDAYLKAFRGVGAGSES